MSFTDTSNAKRYASIAEVAAAQCKMYTEEARMAPEYTDLAKQYADSSKLSAEAATSAAQQALAADSSAVASASSALSSAESASNDAASALSSAASASESADIASGAVNKTLRVSDSDISPLPNAAGRAGKVLTFDASGNAQVSTPASGSATDVLIELAKPTGASLIGYEEKTVADICGDVDSILLPNTRELWARTVSEAGLVLVDGSFESGATISAANQALWYENGAQCYWYSGELPKLVPEGSTPESTGGVSTGQWVSVEGDGARSWVKSNIGLSDTMDELISNLNTVGAAIIHGTHEVPSTGLPVPRECVLSATGQAISFAGNIQHNSGYFHKTGNDTVFLEPISGATPSATVDAIIYLDPKRTPDNIYAQKSTLENIAIQGDEISPNEYGIFCLTGGNYTFRSIDVAGCKYGFSAVDMFLSTFDRFVTNGSIQSLGGTSTTFINCWAKGNSTIRGAWHIENLNYSSLIGCASDGAPDGAYYFKTVNSVTLTGCGAESARKTTANTGLAITFDSDCNMIIDGFLYRPRTNDTEPLIVAGANNHVKINNFVSNVAVPYSSADIYVYGNNTVIEISQSRFRSAKTQPVVNIEPGCTGKVVVHLEGGNTAVFSAGATKDTPLVEYEYEREAFNPILLIGGQSTGITYSSRSGTWAKSGNLVVVNFTMTLSNKGALTGNLTIGNLPFNVPANAGGLIINYANMANGPFSLGSVTGGNDIAIRRQAASATIIATNAEINNDSVISGTIAYQIASSAFNTVPA